MDRNRSVPKPLRPQSVDPATRQIDEVKIRKTASVDSAATKYCEKSHATKDHEHENTNRTQSLVCVETIC